MNVLRLFWNKWRAFGHWMADLVGRIVMLVFYFTFAAPFGLGVRLFSDPLKLKPELPQWTPREVETPALDDARRSF